MLALPQTMAVALHDLRNRPNIPQVFAKLDHRAEAAPTLARAAGNPDRFAQDSNDKALTREFETPHGVDG